MARHGDTVFIHNNPRIKEPGTYLGWIIRWFLDVVNWIKGLPPIRENHCGNIIEENGVLYLIETGWNPARMRGEVIKTEWNRWKTARDQGYYEVKTPGFKYDPDIYAMRLNYSLGTPYDFPSVLFYQPIYQLTGIWIGRKGEKALRKLQCNELSAWAYQLDGWEKMDPTKLYYDYKWIDNKPMKLTETHKQIISKRHNNVLAAEAQLEAARMEFIEAIKLAAGKEFQTFKIENDELILDPEVKEEAK